MLQSMGLQRVKHDLVLNNNTNLRKCCRVMIVNMIQKVGKKMDVQTKMYKKFLFFKLENIKKIQTELKNTITDYNTKNTLG